MSVSGSSAPEGARITENGAAVDGQGVDLARGAGTQPGVTSKKR